MEFINTESFERHLDSDTGSVLFYKKDFQGIPDKVIHGEGYTIEIKEQEVVIFDIYNPGLLISKLTENTLKAEAA